MTTKETQAAIILLIAGMYIGKAVMDAIKKLNDNE